MHNHSTIGAIRVNFDDEDAAMARMPKRVRDFLMFDSEVDWGAQTVEAGFAHFMNWDVLLSHLKNMSHQYHRTYGTNASPSPPKYPRTPIRSIHSGDNGGRSQRHRDHPSGRAGARKRRSFTSFY